MNFKQKWNLVTAVIAAVALLFGFALGRVSVMKTNQNVPGAETETLVSGNTDIVGTTQEQPEENSSEGETVPEKDLNSDLKDAADQEYASSGQTTEMIRREGQTDIPSKITTVDPAVIENSTLQEAPLPAGVASTLYGKTGKALFQVVVLGDSQFASFLGTEGLGYLLSQKLHANVYNLALGGKCAAAEQADRGKDMSQWETTCGVNLMKAIVGEQDATCLNGWDYQMNVFSSCDFSKTDLFVLEYGVNDYLTKKPMYDENDPGSVYTYFGALESMILDIRNYFPDAQILVCTPTYAQFWQGGTGAFLGDSNTVNNGYGTLYNYVETATHPAGGHQNTSTVNEYENSGIDVYTASDDLLDGIHMTDTGRVKYVNLLSRVGLRALGYDIDEGVDPDTIDWISQNPKGK